MTAGSVTRRLRALIHTEPYYKLSMLHSDCLLLLKLLHHVHYVTSTDAFILVCVLFSLSVSAFISSFHILSSTTASRRCVITAHEQHPSIPSCIPPSCPGFTHLKVTPHKIIFSCSALIQLLPSFSVNYSFTVSTPQSRTVLSVRPTAADICFIPALHLFTHQLDRFLL